MSRGWPVARVIGLAALVGLAFGALFSWLVNREQDDALEAAVSEMDTGAVRERSENFMAPEPASLKGIPPYPNAAPRKLMSRPRVSGAVMSISWFSTKDSTEDVRRFYFEAFQKAGHTPVSHVFEDGTGYVGWMDNDRDGGLADGTLHMLTLVPNKRDTTVLVSSSRPSDMDSAQSDVGDDFYLPPSATSPQALAMEENQQRKSVFWQSNETRAALQAFIEKKYTEMGWSLANQSETGRDVLVAKKDRIAVTISISSDKVGGSQVMMTKERNQ